LGIRLNIHTGSYQAVLKKSGLKISDIETLLSIAKRIVSQLSFWCGATEPAGFDDSTDSVKDSFKTVIDGLWEKWEKLGGSTGA